jgi:C4-dicarboxylate-specific signal transduction histidine kinase
MAPIALPPAVSRVLSAGMLRFYRRPMLFLFGVVVLPLALTVAVVYRIQRQRAIAQSLQHLAVTSRLAAEIVERTLAQTLLIEALLAEEPDVQQALARGDAEALVQRVIHLLGLVPALQEAAFVRSDGTVLAAVPPKDPGASVAEAPWFQQARDGDAPLLSPVYLAGGLKVVSVATPVFGSSGQRLGVLHVLYGVDDVRDWLQTVRVEPDGFLYVVDHRQQLVVHPRQLLPGRPKRVADWPPVARPLDAGALTLAFREPRTGRAWLAAAHPVGSRGWRVVATQPRHEALRTVHRIFLWLGVLLLAVLWLVLLVCRRWARMHDFSLHLLRQNAKLLRQVQQHRTLGRRRPDGSGGPEA